MTLAKRLEEQAKKEARANAPKLGEFGEEGGTLRVFNFAGGGFDSIMQLGVTHALLVNKGRSPDVVVGVSAGALDIKAKTVVM